MKLNLKGKNVNVHSDLKEVAERKIGRLDKYFHEDLNAMVAFSNEKNEKKVELTIYLRETTLRAESAAEDFQSAIDRSIDAIERQIRKHKTKLQKRYNKGKTIRFENIYVEKDEMIAEEKEEGKPKIIKVKRFGLKPMDEEEAALQMELIGHNFFVFLDHESDMVKVLYRRKDGNYGLIEPEIK